jgi:DNA repair exonuclease SbcCD ATPase subunit
MSEIEAKSRKMLAGMFGGEQVIIGQNLTDELRVEEPRTLETEIKQLPDEIVLYLRSLAPNFPEFVNDLIAELLESLEEKEASRRLWERFGLPQTPLAVPVFVDLSETLGEAQDEVVTRAGEVQALAYRLAQIIEKISLFYAMRVNQLEAEEQAHEQAIQELGLIETRGSTMQKSTAESVGTFAQRQRELAQEKEQALVAQGSWQQQAREWMNRLPILKSLETPLDLGAPDPVMAL